MKDRDQFIFLLGPHRSGTSLTAGALHFLQVNLGSRFIKANEDNPKGFFEDEDIVNFNDRLLRSINLSWDSLGFIWDQDFSAPKFKPYHNAAIKMILQRFASVRFSGLKDPRFCLLLPFWQRVITEALDVDVSYVLTIRDPAECVVSQQTRHNRDGDFHIMGRRQIDVLLLWLTYIRRALKQVDPDRLAIVDYASLVLRPETEISRLAGFLGLEVTGEQLATFCDELVDASLRRSNPQRGIRRSQNSLAWEIAENTYGRLVLLSSQNPIRRENISDILSELQAGRLDELYLQEVQYMYGYAYKKTLSLRHRLLQEMAEVSRERGMLGELVTAHQELQQQHVQAMAELGSERNVLGELVTAHEALKQQHVLLAEKNGLLFEQKNELENRLQGIINSRGWKILSTIRRYLRGNF